MSLRDQITKIVYEYGCLNTHEVCRAINGLDIYNPHTCGLSSKVKPFGKGTKEVLGLNNINCMGILNKTCAISYYRVRATLFRMNINHVKMRFWDNTRFGGNGRRSDLFNFWFYNFKAFKNRILNQTLIPYLKEPELLLVNSTEKQKP